MNYDGAMRVQELLGVALGGVLAGCTARPPSPAASAERIPSSSTTESAAVSVAPLPPATSSNIAASKAPLPVLKWTAEWEGAAPQLFAEGPDVVLTVTGPSKLAGAVVSEADEMRKGATLWIVRLGIDRSIRSRVAFSRTVRSARGLALFPNGDLLINYVGADDGLHAIARVRADGSAAWTRAAGVDKDISLVVSDEVGTRFAAVVNGSSRSVGSAPRPTSELRVYEEDGSESLAVELTGAFSIKALALSLEALAFAGTYRSVLTLRPRGSADVTLPSERAPLFAASVGVRGHLNWVLAPGTKTWLEATALRFSNDGNLLMLGRGMGHAAIQNALFPSLQATPPDAGPEGPTHFTCVLDQHGRPVSLQQSASEATDWSVRTGTATLKVERLRAEEVQLSAWSGDGMELYRLSAMTGSVDGAIALQGGGLVVQGQFPAMLLFSDIEGPTLVSSTSRRYLSLYDPAGPTNATTAIRRPGLYEVGTFLAHPDEGASNDALVAARTSLRSGRYKDACRLYARGLQAKTSAWEDWVGFSRCLQKNDEVAGAVLAAHQALHIAPTAELKLARTLHARQDGYRVLTALGKRQSLDFSRRPCAALRSDTSFCDKEVFVCGASGTYGPNVHHIVNYTFARFALNPASAEISDSSEFAGAADGIFPDVDRTFYDGPAVEFMSAYAAEDLGLDGRPASLENFQCELIHVDGCSGVVVFSCSSEANAGHSPEHRIVEVLLRRE